MWDSLFSCYAKHQTELNEIVDEIAENSDRNRRGSLNISSLDDLSKSDLDYISRSLKNKGLDVKLFLK